MACAVLARRDDVKTHENATATRIAISDSDTSCDADNIDVRRPLRLRLRPLRLDGLESSVPLPLVLDASTLAAWKQHLAFVSVSTLEPPIAIAGVVVGVDVPRNEEYEESESESESLSLSCRCLQKYKYRLLSCLILGIQFLFYRLSGDAIC